MSKKFKITDMVGKPPTTLGEFVDMVLGHQLETIAGTHKRDSAPFFNVLVELAAKYGESVAHLLKPDRLTLKQTMILGAALRLTGEEFDGFHALIERQYGVTDSDRMALGDYGRMLQEAESLWAGMETRPRDPRDRTHGEKHREEKDRTAHRKPGLG